MNGSLWLVSASSALAAAVYVAVGVVVGRRPVEQRARLALAAFEAWWYGLGLATACGAVTTALAATTGIGVDPLLAITLVILALICLALWGLLYYLVYLFTGRRGAWLPLAVFYVAYFGFLVWLILSAGPVGVESDDWGVQLEYRDPLADTALGMVALALLILPQIVGALAYFSLVFRLDERAARFRVAVVSGSILVWFGSSYLASATGVSDRPSWQVATRLIGLAAALAILLAYQTPAWLQRRLRLEPAPGPRTAQ